MSVIFHWRLGQIVLKFWVVLPSDSSPELLYVGLIILGNWEIDEDITYRIGVLGDEMEARIDSLM